MQIYKQSEYNKRSIHRAITNSDAKSTLKLYSESPRMIPLGLNPVCHRMPISVPAYSAARKPQRKRKSDGDESGKSRKRKSAGEKSGEAENTEQCSEAVNDVDADSEQPVAKPTRRKRTKKSKVEDADVISVLNEEDSTAKRKRPSKKSKAERVTGPSSLAENFDVISVPDEDSTEKRRRLADCRRLTDKLQSPLLRVIEAQDLDDFDEGERPVESVQVQDAPESISHPLDRSPCHEITVNIETHAVSENYRKPIQLLDDVGFSGSEAGLAKCRTNVATSSTNRSRVRTPPTFEETSAALQAIEDADRLSPIDVKELVEYWKREKTEQSAFPSHSAVSNDDNDLPAFGMGSKPCRKVLNGETDNQFLDAGRLESELRTIPDAESSSDRRQIPLRETVESSDWVDQSEGFSVHANCEDEVGMHSDHSHLERIKCDLGSDLPVAAMDFNQMSWNILPKKLLIPNGHIPKAGDRKIRGDSGGKQNLGFSRPVDNSVVKPHAASEQRGFLVDKNLSQHWMSDVLNELLSFDDTNDDEFLAAAVATPVIQNRAKELPGSVQISDGSANVSGVNTADNTQLTFTQALACVHDSIDLTRPYAESPGIRSGKSGTAECGAEKSMKVDEPHFDLGFELSDDDNDDDDDDDIIPPSPPLSCSLKSGGRLGNRANSLITISRQNSYNSITATGPRTDQLVDAANVDCPSMRKTESVTEEMVVGNGLVSNLFSSVERPSSKVVCRNSAAEVRIVAVEQKSRDCSPVAHSVEKKLRDRAPVSERSPGTGDQKSRDLPSTVQSSTVDMEQQLRQQSVTRPNTLAVDEKSTDPVRSSQVAVIHPCVRPLATLTTPADQSEMISPPSVLSSSTPFKSYMDEKCEFLQ